MYMDFNYLSTYKKYYGDGLLKYSYGRRWLSGSGVAVGVGIGVDDGAGVVGTTSTIGTVSFFLYHRSASVIQSERFRKQPLFVWYFYQRQ